MGYVLLGAMAGAWIVAASVVVARRAERGNHRWGATREQAVVRAGGAYRSAVVSRWRALRAPRVALVAAWSAVMVAIACVPAGLVALVVAGATVWLDDAPPSSAVLLCAAPIALARGLFSARGALGLLDADLALVARARAQARWEKVFDTTLIVAMLAAITYVGRLDGFALAGLAWGLLALAHAVLVSRAARTVGSRLGRLVLEPEADAPAAIA